MRKILGTITAATLLTIISLVPAAMPTGVGVTGTAIVGPNSICAVDANPKSLNFGSLNPTETSLDQVITITQPGSGNKADIGAEVSGDTWTGVTLTNTMDVGQTHWALATFTYGTGDHALSTTPTSIGATIGPLGSHDVHFMLQIPGGKVVDTYTQHITVTACL